jgi:transcription antitermination factor NusG
MYGPRMNEGINSTVASRSGVPIVAHGNGMYDPEFRWYAVWTRSRQEKVASTMLNTLGVQHYLPLKSELRQWSDRKQMVEMPVFSGYLFVRINLMKASRLQVLKSPGVVAFVGNQAGPLPIPDQQIEDIRIVLTVGAKCSVQPFLKEGDRVRVVRGALAGVEGTLVRTNSESHLLISIDMIRQSLAVSVSPEDIEPLAPAPFARRASDNQSQPSRSILNNISREDPKTQTTPGNAFPTEEQLPRGAHARPDHVECDSQRPPRATAGWLKPERETPPTRRTPEPTP